MAEFRPVTGLFRDRDSAERAYQAVIDRGYGRGDVDLVMSDETRSRHFGSTPDGRTTELGTKAAEGAGIGGAIGGTVGAIAAAVAAVGCGVCALVVRGLPELPRCCGDVWRGLCAARR